MLKGIWFAEQFWYMLCVSIIITSKWKYGGLEVKFTGAQYCQVLHGDVMQWHARPMVDIIVFLNDFFLDCQPSKLYIGYTVHHMDIHGFHYAWTKNNQHN